MRPIIFHLPIMCILAALVSCDASAADAPTVETVDVGVTMVHDDSGNWGGGSMGSAHQNRPDYQVRKTIDLAALPVSVLKQATEARLRVFFAVQDYSWNIGDRTWNGLDEEFELLVNGHPHTYKTNQGFPGRDRAGVKLEWDWHDFAIPVDELKAGSNVFLFRKLPAERNDDYIYVGIDNTERHGNSQVSFDGGATWTGERLNAIDAQGEYMVRLVLIEGELGASATWSAGPPTALDDEYGLVGYVGRNGEEMRLELDAAKFDPQGPIEATVETVGGAQAIVEWTSRDGGKLKARPAQDGLAVTSTLAASRQLPSTLTIRGPEPRRVRIAYSRRYLPGSPVIDMCPAMAQPAGKPASRRASCRRIERGDGTAWRLENPYLRCEIMSRDEGGPQLVSLVSEMLGRECLVDAGAARLFLVEVAGKRYGASDFRTVSAEPLADPETQGVAFHLELEDVPLSAELSVWVGDDPELHMALTLTASGEEPVTFKTAFPHIDGLRLSDDPANDYYLFPYFGGTIANAATYLRTAYGENSAWWQFIDVFSPQRGGGVYLRCEDATGLFKCPAFRKGRSYGGLTYNRIGTVMDREMWWDNSLGAGDDSAMTFEYIQRTRQPGETFRVPAACIGVHEGDWRVAMGRYAAWAHEVWGWRARPSRLTGRWSILAPGWGQNPLFKDGAYRTDFIQEGSDVAELMSFWEWSDLGPWRVPMDHETLPKDLGEALYNRYKAYWVTNPATGKLQYPLNRGDYKYNETWGGLPALKRYVKQIQDSGTLATYYVEGILCCDTTETGHTYGRKYGVKNPLWKDSYSCPKNPPGYVASYGSWNMCADTEFWPDYLAETYSRLLRDTGADGLRLDEYGHRGYVCHNDQHEHLFAEPGHNAWMQAVGRACRVVHEAMDEVAPDLVLMTEFPGCDYVAASLDGCIVYETMSHIQPFRPVPCNLFRFYFPECKVYDLSRDSGLADDNLKFWNGSATFGGMYPKSYYRILRENSDAFDGSDFEPLVSTLKPRLYANRFTDGAKTIFTLYNATGFTVDGPLLGADAGENAHYFDLLNCAEVEPVAADGRPAIPMAIERDWIGCIAVLPRRLSVERDGAELKVSVAGVEGDAQLVLADREGKRLAERPLQAGMTHVRIPDGVDPACLKLMIDGSLEDVVAVPAT